MKKILLTLLVLTALPFAMMAVSTRDTYYMQRAAEAVRGGDKETAIQYLSRELDDNPTNGYAHMWVAIICAHMDSYGWALQYAQSALQYLPKQDHESRSDMNVLLSEIYVDAKDTTLAVSYLEKAQKEYPQDIRIYNKLVYISEDGDNNADALRYAQMAVKNLPKLQRAYFLMVSALMTNERYDEALANCNKALKLAKEDAKARSLALSYRAEVYYRDKQPSAALADLMSATRLDGAGMDETLMRQIADTIPDEVRDTLLAAHEQEPEQLFWSIYLYHFYYDTNEFLKAAQLSFSLLPKYSSNNNVYYLASLLEFHIGDAELAERLLLKQLRTDSTSAGTYVRLEELYAEQCRYNEAFEMADKALSFNPTDREKSMVYFLRGRLYELKHDYTKAIEDYMAGMIADPDEYDQWFRIGKLYGLMNDSVKQAEAFEQGHKAFAAHGRELTAEVYVVLKDTAAAYEATQKRMTKKKSAEQHYNAACVFAQIGYTEEALQHLRLAFEYGFRSFYHIAWDTDLNSLRDLPEFEQMVNEYKQRTEQQKQELRASIDTELNY